MELDVKEITKEIQKSSAKMFFRKLFWKLKSINKVF